MATSAIPRSIDEVTPAWVADVTGWEVEDLTAERIGLGVGMTSTVYRLDLVTEPSAPASVIVKMPALDPGALMIAETLALYRREVAFFTDLASRSPLRVPHPYHAVVDAESGRFIVVMEDLGHLRSVDQVAGVQLEDAYAAVDRLADWQVEFWGEGDEILARTPIRPASDPIFLSILPDIFRAGFAALLERGDPPEVVREAGARFPDRIGELLADSPSESKTLCHGDYRADNLLFGDHGEVAALDFQLIAAGPAAFDLAYFITQSLDEDVAHHHEQELIERWLNRLVRLGVPEQDLEGMRDRYRLCALFCLVYPVIGGSHLDAGVPRQDELRRRMIRRIDRAITDLDLLELL